MREILFRGKTDKGEWVQGDLLHPDLYGNGYAIEDFTKEKNNCFDVVPSTVGQYTGLTDKNGTKIFEGDIVKLYRESYDWSENKAYIEEEINVVKFDKGSFYLDFSYSGDGYNEISCLYDEITKNGEVIGNIYDNLELVGE